MTSFRRWRVALAAVLWSVTPAGFALAAEHGGQEHGGQEETGAGPEGSSGAGQTQAIGEGFISGPQQPGNRQPTAEEMREMMQGVMGPMMGEMMASMLKSMSKTMAEPEIAQNLATFTRNYYQALVDRGFTEEEALKIVTSSGFPTLAGGK